MPDCADMVDRQVVHSRLVRFRNVHVWFLFVSEARHSPLARLARPARTEFQVRVQFVHRRSARKRPVAVATDRQRTGWNRHRHALLSSARQKDNAEKRRNGAKFETEQRLSTWLWRSVRYVAFAGLLYDFGTVLFLSLFVFVWLLFVVLAKSVNQFAE